jgi:hypothetical protein
LTETQARHDTQIGGLITQVEKQNAGIEKQNAGIRAANYAKYANKGRVIRVIRGS